MVCATNRSRLVLASASPRRKMLLEQIGLSFVVEPSDVSEDVAGLTDPVQICRRLASDKARAVGSRIGQGLVLGADTIVVLGNQILGKPSDRQEAIEMLSSLAGRAHQVFTGLAVVDASSGAETVDHEVTDVWMRELTRRQVEAYVDSGEPMDKAGSYAVQGLGSVLVERIEGCYYNVVGLPVPKLVRMLETLGISILG